MTRQAVEMTFPENLPASSRVPEIRTQALTVPARAKGLIVKDQESLTAANQFVQDLKCLELKICETFDPQIAKAHALHKSLIAEKKKFIEPLELARKIVNPRIIAYLDEQDKIKREAERKRAEAEEKARKLSEKAVEKAEKLEEKGESGKATTVIEEAYEKVESIMEAAPSIPEEPKTDGLSTRVEWKFEIIDAKAIPREYLIPDETKIGRIVRAMKGDINIPGVRVFSVKNLVNRADGLKDDIPF